MKIGKHFGTVSALLLVAGCAQHERQARYSDFNYGGSSSTPTYQQPGSASSSTSSTSTTNTFSQGTSSETDRSLVSQVQQTLRQDTTLAALMPGIQITAQNGSVTLSGNVSSEQEKQRVEAMVKSTSGVVNVNNQLQVSVAPTSDRPGQGTRLYQESTPSSPTKPDSSSSPAPDLSKSDTSTTSDAATSTASPTTSETTPSPTSQPGASSRIYTDTAKTSDNVSLNVQGLTDADRSLGQKIQEEMRKDSSLAAQLGLIKLNIDSGKIALTGSVKSEEQKQAIEQAVQRVTGVNSVDNQLQVSGSATDPSTSQPAPQN